MQEKNLKHIALLITILGLFLLSLYAQSVSHSIFPDSSMLTPSTYTQIEGTITSLSQTERTTFLTVEGKQTSQTKVIIFSDQDLYLKEGNSIQINGRIQEYKGEKEIIADNVIVK